jgi:hypothetical protein
MGKLRLPGGADKWLGERSLSDSQAQLVLGQEQGVAGL